MKFKTDKNVTSSNISRTPSLRQIIENTNNLYYCEGIKNTFDNMHEYCQNRHQVQNPEGGQWFVSCFLLESKEYNKNTWQCCFDNCPLL